MSLEVEVRHRLGAFTLDARFRAEAGLTVLFGRSGSGKTTLVNMIAGLIRPEAGRITVDGEALFDAERRVWLPKHRRRIGYVFQEGRLFPHLSVRQNLLYGRWFTPGTGSYGSLDDVVGLLGIGGLLERRPDSLSGGEKQRVAIGRALLASPRLLLMDEPLASLDAARKAEILPYVERLRDEAGIPIVYVSHSVGEVVRLATTVVLLADGAVEAVGPVSQVLGHLDAGSSDTGAVLTCRVAAHEPATGLTRLDGAAGAIRVPRMGLAVGAPARLLVRARDVLLALEPPRALSALNVLPGTVMAIEAGDGASVQVRLDCGGEALVARITRHSVETLGLRPGLPVYAVVKSMALAGDELAERELDA